MDQKQQAWRTARAAAPALIAALALPAPAMAAAEDTPTREATVTIANDTGCKLARESQTISDQASWVEPFMPLIPSGGRGGAVVSIQRNMFTAAATYRIACPGQSEWRAYLTIEDTVEPNELNGGAMLPDGLCSVVEWSGSLESRQYDFTLSRC